MVEDNILNNKHIDRKKILKLIIFSLVVLISSIGGGLL